MQDQSARASLVETMRRTDQTAGMTVLEHGKMVADYYEDLIEHLETGTPLRHEWRLPEWTNDPVILTQQMSRATMREYHVFHDCGKPLCLVIDDEGRRHFPGHAEASRKAWLDTGGNKAIGELIGMDMDAHLLKADAIEEFASRPQAASLLLTALAEIHANAAMFGGIESTSFKIKWKHLDKRGRQVLALMKKVALPRAA